MALLSRLLLRLVSKVRVHTGSALHNTATRTEVSLSIDVTSAWVRKKDALLGRFHVGVW